MASSPQQAFERRSCRWLPVLLLGLAVCVISCGGGGSDPVAVQQETTGLGGTLSSGGNLANVPVTTLNQYAFCENIIRQIHQAYSSAFMVVGHSDQFETVRITGNIKGHALAKTLPIQVIQPTGRDVFFMDTTTFNDYSNDGQLYMGGSLEFIGIWREIDGVRLPVELGVSGELRFAGIYKGRASFSTNILFNDDGSLYPVGVPSTGIPNGGIVRIRDGDKIVLDINPYPFLAGP
jgi:hypothetical protein